ncbi:MAG TPA: DinB family protein [Candidatus Angelobacter sp.]
MSALPNPLSIAAENARLVALLRESRERFLASFAEVTEQDCRRSPAEGCWSVMDCVEHLVAAESLMLKRLQTERNPRPAGAPNREQVFLERMGSRERKVLAPESGQPSGRFPTIDAARKRFEEVRGATIRFAEDNTDDLRATEVMHPHPLVGIVSSYEMLIIIAKHAERHALQIQDIKAALSRGILAEFETSLDLGKHGRNT